MTKFKRIKTNIKCYLFVEIEKGEFDRREWWPAENRKGYKDTKI